MVVEVKNPSAQLWNNSMKFEARSDVMRRSPVVHVNQVGYMPDYPKKAMVGFYLGSMGELPIPTAGGFELRDTSTAQAVFSGTLKVRRDQGKNE